MDYEYADHVWKIECFRAAVQEQIEVFGKIDNIIDLYVRAKQIYEEGNNNYINTTTKDKPKEEKAVVENNNDGTKTCPHCKEKIPSTWKKHTFKKDGTKCGQTFKE